MNTSSALGQRDKWIMRAILPLVAIAILAAIAVELNGIFRYRQIAQCVADYAVFGGTVELVATYNGHSSSTSDQKIKTAINESAERYASRGCYGRGADKLLDHETTLTGYYLDANGNSLSSIDSSSPEVTRGLKVIAHIVAPTFLSSIAGLDGWLLKADAVMQFDVACDEEGNCYAYSKMQGG